MSKETPGEIKDRLNNLPCDEYAPESELEIHTEVAYQLARIAEFLETMLKQGVWADTKLMGKTGDADTCGLCGQDTSHLVDAAEGHPGFSADLDEPQQRGFEKED